MAEVVVLPPTLDITVYGGDDVTIPATVSQAGAPLNLDTDQLAQIRSTADGPTVLGEIDVVVLSAPSGQANLVVSGTMTQALLDGPAATKREWKQDGVTYSRLEFVGVYDWQQGTDVGNDVLTLCRGSFTVQGDVTRETP